MRYEVLSVSGMHTDFPGILTKTWTYFKEVSFTWIPVLWFVMWFDSPTSCFCWGMGHFDVESRSFIDWMIYSDGCHENLTGPTPPGVISLRTPPCLGHAREAEGLDGIGQRGNYYSLSVHRQAVLRMITRAGFNVILVHLELIAESPYLPRTKGWNNYFTARCLQTSFSWRRNWAFFARGFRYGCPLTVLVARSVGSRSPGLFDGRHGVLL